VISAAQLEIELQSHLSLVWGTSTPAKHARKNTSIRRAQREETRGSKCDWSNMMSYWSLSACATWLWGHSAYRNMADRCWDFDWFCCSKYSVLCVMLLYLPVRVRGWSLHCLLSRAPVPTCPRDILTCHVCFCRCCSTWRLCWHNMIRYQEITPIRPLPGTDFLS